MQRRIARAYPSLEREHLREKAAGRPAEAEKAVFARGCGFYKLACLFFIAAFLGDLIEMVFCRLTMGVWMSRSSVVWGPFSVVWGLGAVLLTAVLYKYKDRERPLYFPGGHRGGRGL